MATFSSEHCASTRCKQYPPTPCPPRIVPPWTMHICSQSPVGWLLFFCVRGWSLRLLWRDGLRHKIPDNCTQHHAWSNSPSQSLPAGEGIDGCLSWTVVYLFAHNHFCFLLINRCCLFCQSSSIS